MDEHLENVGMDEKAEELEDLEPKIKNFQLYMRYSGELNQEDYMDETEASSKESAAKIFYARMTEEARKEYKVEEIISYIQEV